MLYCPFCGNNEEQVEECLAMIAEGSYGETVEYQDTVYCGNCLATAPKEFWGQRVNREAHRLAGRVSHLKDALRMMLDWDGDNESTPEYAKRVLKGKN